MTQVIICDAKQKIIRVEGGGRNVLVFRSDHMDCLFMKISVSLDQTHQSIGRKGKEYQFVEL